MHNKKDLLNTKKAVMEQPHRLPIRKENFNNAIHQLDLIDIYEITYPATEKYTFFSSA